MITPINKHILIKPLQHDSFLVSQNDTYEEVGIVVKTIKIGFFTKIKKGNKVFFDSWLAAKYPTGKDNEYFWLVRYEDIRAIEKNEI